MSPVNEMLVGMAEFFLQDGAITEKTGKRLFRGMEKQRALAHDALANGVAPESVVASPLGWFVEYEITGSGERGLLSNAKSKFTTENILFRFFGQFPADAAACYDLYYDYLLSQADTGRYHGTWNGHVIQGARWVDGSEAEGRDSAIKMSFLEANLFVPFVA